MQVPIGVLGRAGGAEDLALPRLDDALEHLAALARLRVGDAHAGHAVAPLGVEVGVGVGQAQRALGDEAQAAPLEVRAQREDLGHHLQRAQVALVGDDAPVLVLDLAAARRASWRRIIWTDCRRSTRLEARDDDRLAVVGGDELEGPRADDGRHVARADEAVEAQVGRVEQRAQRRHDRHVVAHAREVRDALGLGALERQRGRRRRRLEADREEDDLAVGVLAWRCAARRAASRPSARRRPAPWRPAACRRSRARAACRRSR